MIRIAETDGWLLIDHRDHARLAGEFAQRWGNADFAPPEPRAEVITAVTRHDDAWVEHDAAPTLTREGRPGAFSRELVGSYRAFEEIDLADYLRVRGRACEIVATENPYAAIVISMHTVNLLTEQADLSALSAADRAMHREFIAAQQERQRQLCASVATDQAGEKNVKPGRLQRAFEFLQACDSLSLMVCVDYPEPRPLRHRHPRRDGSPVVFTCTPLGARNYRVDPWPFAEADVHCNVPARRIVGRTFATLNEFRAALASAAPTFLEATLTP